MKIVAIITEYNPFHNGHEYQIKKIRELLGYDTAVIAIMSGNYIQRGGPAIADKTIRAKAAVDCGVNLVLELPFPYSMSSAEFFARAGVHIASNLKIVDHLAFGSENGNIDKLCAIAKNMSSEKFRSELITAAEAPTALGYPKLCERVYNSLFPERLTQDFFTPNNILAIEYLKALEQENSNITPITIKREGGGYDSSYTDGTQYQSASYIRELIYSKDDSAFDFVPENAKLTYFNAIKSGKMPTQPKKLDAAIISSFRLNPPALRDNIHDAEGGLYNRLYSMSMTEATISSLMKRAETKKFTQARIRRAIWSSYLGVTSSDVRTLPEYTQLLALDDVGRSLLKRIKKVSDFPIITKPSSYKDCSDRVVWQKELANKADSVFDLTLIEPNSATFSLTFTPYVKK
ncbi:MAG: nucleotidyltransferase family protein [Clostridia bacterium]|nr:nucleotidyltransferase family protein [Clostridia bacterium]